MKAGLHRVTAGYYESETRDGLPVVIERVSPGLYERPSMRAGPTRREESLWRLTVNGNVYGRYSKLAEARRAFSQL